jgi:pilus assembly protein Flp/PilA
MQNVIAAVARLAHVEHGQDLLEYGLLAALIAVVALAGVTALGQQISAVFWDGIAQNF